VSNNGKPVLIRMQTKDELIDALRDQCKFWRSMWSDSVDLNLEMDRISQSVDKQLKEIREHLDKLNDI
jgi:hypothetical protein